jgi:hypothetical protein
VKEGKAIIVEVIFSLQSVLESKWCCILRQCEILEIWCPFIFPLFSAQGLHLNPALTYLQFYEDMLKTYGTVDAGVFVPLILTLKDEQHVSFIEDSVKRMAHLRTFGIGTGKAETGKTAKENIAAERESMEKLYYRNFMWIQRAMSESLEIELRKTSHMKHTAPDDQHFQSLNENCVPKEAQSAGDMSSSVVQAGVLSHKYSRKGSPELEQDFPLPNNQTTTTYNLYASSGQQPQSFLQTSSCSNIYIGAAEAMSTASLLSLLQDTQAVPKTKIPTPMPRFVEINVDCMEETLDFIHGLLLHGIDGCLSVTPQN